VLYDNNVWAINARIGLVYDHRSCSIMWRLSFEETQTEAEDIMNVLEAEAFTTNK